MSFISYGFCKHLGFTRLHLLLWYTLFRNCKLNSLASSIDKVYSLGLLKLLFIYFFSFCLFTFLLDVYPWISHFISLRSTVFKTREGKTKELLRSLPSLILSGFKLFCNLNSQSPNTHIPQSLSFLCLPLSPPLLTLANRQRKTREIKTDTEVANTVFKLQ